MVALLYICPIRMALNYLQCADIQEMTVNFYLIASSKLRGLFELQQIGLASSTALLMLIQKLYF